MAQVAGMLKKKKKARPNSKAPLGQGGRFAAMVQDIEQSGKSEAAAKAIAAAAGRRKYGKRKFASLGAAGRRRRR